MATLNLTSVYDRDCEELFWILMSSTLYIYGEVFINNLVGLPSILIVVKKGSKTVHRVNWSQNRKSNSKYKL